jgi:hypothetical protein
MDVNSIQNILRPPGWARRLIAACITVLYMSVLHANIAAIQHVGSNQMAAGRPITTALRTTNQFQRSSTTTALAARSTAGQPPDEPRTRGPRGHKHQPTALNCAEHAAVDGPCSNGTAWRASMLYGGVYNGLRAVRASPR